MSSFKKLQLEGYEWKARLPLPDQFARGRLAFYL